MINKILIDNITSQELKEKGESEQKIQKEIENMGEEAQRYYNKLKDDPFITDFMAWDFGFAFLCDKDTIRYLYIKPSERNKGWCSKIVKYFKINDPSPEIIHIMDKNGLLYDLESVKELKLSIYPENEIIGYNVELGYQFKIQPWGLVASYNKWNGEDFEVIDIIFPPYQFQLMIKKMKEYIEKLKTSDYLRIESGFPNLYW